MDRQHKETTSDNRHSKDVKQQQSKDVKYPDMENKKTSGTDRNVARPAQDPSHKDTMRSPGKR